MRCPPHLEFPRAAKQEVGHQEIEHAPEHVTVDDDSPSPGGDANGDWNGLPRPRQRSEECYSQECTAEEPGDVVIPARFRHDRVLHGKGKAEGTWGLRGAVSFKSSRPSRLPRLGA